MVVSQTLQRYYWERYGRHTIYIPNGARLAHKGPLKCLPEWELTADNYILYLGRFSPEKNCHLLMDAFENVSTGMKLVLAGGSSHSDDYVESLRRRASDRIRLLPWTSGEDLDELLSNAARATRDENQVFHAECRGSGSMHESNEIGGQSPVRRDPVKAGTFPNAIKRR